MRGLRTSAALLAWAASAALAWAGPPFLTDDPEPTELHHWEIYAPELDVAGRGGAYDGAFGAEINYGAAPELQLSLGLPSGFTREDGAFRTGLGDVRASAKYRFFHDEAAGVSVAAFPGVSLPTATHGQGAGRVTGFLPVWAQKSAGDWAMFGGGGYAFNPGPGARDYWTGGVAVTRTFGKTLLLGAEVQRQGASTVDGSASTSLGLGAIVQLRPPFRLLASGGPTFEDHARSPAFHAFLALGLDF